MMETAEALMGMLFNVSLVIMIAATMFSAGLQTTVAALGGVFKNIWLVVLVLVAAFAGYDRIMQAYRHAIEKRYRFFSYGDAMFLTPEG